MNLIAHSVKSKGRVAFVRRIGSIVWRFGLTPAKTERSLRAYLNTLRRHQTGATFPITTTVLQRHPALVQSFAAAGVEFAVHGYTHTDHALLSYEQQYQQIGRALKVFRRAGLAPEGFRGPYLRYNDATISAIQNLGLRYSSNLTVYHDVLDLDQFDARRLAGYQKALQLYSAKPAAQTLVRPFTRGDVVELPVSMPDDEILIDRLGMLDGDDLGRVWLDMLERTHTIGDLLTLQLHPERGTLCRRALDMLLGAARLKSPSVWIAQLRDIANWWRRRASLNLSLEQMNRRQWLVVAPRDTTATILLRNLPSPNAVPWQGDWQRLEGPSTVLESDVAPAIGVSSRSSELAKLLSEEGFVVRGGDDSGDCALRLDHPDPLSDQQKLQILRSIEVSSAPLVRIGRWPSGAQSALAITGDIDALTLFDFISRTWEVR